MQATVQTPTPDLEKSKTFYRLLDFKTVEANGREVVSDGLCCIEINTDRFARAGIKLYQPSWKDEVAQLGQRIKVLPLEDGYLLSDTSGTWIYLIEGDLPFDFTPAETSSSVLGNFAGISLETIDMAASVGLFETLGFKITMGGADQGWIVLTCESGFGVSIMKPNSCPHLFFNPSLTYFNGGKNLPIIKKIRDVGIPITEEITQFNKEGIVDNIIIRDPGGFGFFIFND